MWPCVMRRRARAHITSHICSQAANASSRAVWLTNSGAVGGGAALTHRVNLAMVIEKMWKEDKGFEAKAKTEIEIEIEAMMCGCFLA